jgi:hypothetical protein
MTIIVCYSDGDRSIGKQMRTYLTPLAGGTGFDIWSDSRIGPDRLGEDEIEGALFAGSVDRQLTLMIPASAAWSLPIS